MCVSLLIHGEIALPFSSRSFFETCRRNGPPDVNSTAKCLVFQCQILCCSLLRFSQFSILSIRRITKFFEWFLLPKLHYFTVSRESHELNDAYESQVIQLLRKLKIRSISSHWFFLPQDDFELNIPDSEEQAKESALKEQNQELVGRISFLVTWAIWTCDWAIVFNSKIQSKWLRQTRDNLKKNISVEICHYHRSHRQTTWFPL